MCLFTGGAWWPLLLLLSTFPPALVLAWNKLHIWTRWKQRHIILKEAKCRVKSIMGHEKAHRVQVRFHSVGPQVLHNTWCRTLLVLLCWLGAVVALWASPLFATGLSEQLLEVVPCSSSNSSLLDISSSYSSFDFLRTKKGTKIKCLIYFMN